MELKDIVAISGMPGLYKVVGQRKTGLIVEALDGSGKKFPTSASTKVSMLSDIALYTTSGEEKLAKVLLAIKEQVASGLVVPDKKDNQDVFPQFLLKVLPDFDNERVYLSDMKKLASWYHILADQLDFEELKKSLEEDESEGDGKSDSKVKADSKVKSEKNLKNVAPKGDTKSKGKSVNTIRKMA